MGILKFDFFFISVFAFQISSLIIPVLPSTPCIFIPIIFVVLTLLIVKFFDNSFNDKSNISAYYNSTGSFAGFIQTENGLIRACEFSTNGALLSCSKWFDKDSLKQGQNEGLELEDI